MASRSHGTAGRDRTRRHPRLQQFFGQEAVPDFASARVIVCNARVGLNGVFMRLRDPRLRS